MGKIIGFIAKVPTGSKPVGYFEPYTTGEFKKYPHIWEPVYEMDIRSIQLLKHTADQEKEFSNSLLTELSKAGKQLHSLRLAVLQYMIARDNLLTHKDKHDEFTVSYNKLALSAGIHFENGEWKLKD